MPQIVIDNFGGLVASMRPSDLPMGASPRTFNTDFLASRFLQRPGRQSVFSYSGESVGPNPPFSAVNTSRSLQPWMNPSNLLLDDANYASVVLASAISDNSTTATGNTSGGGVAWSNPGNIDSAVSYASVALTSGGTNYTPSTSSGYISATATSSSPSVIQEKVLSGFASIASSACTLYVTISGTVQGASIAYLDYSTNSGATWTNAQSWSADFGTVVAIPISGISNLDTVQIRLRADAEWIFPLGPVVCSLTCSNWYASVASGSGLTSQALQATISGLSVPSTATITGVSISVKGYYTGVAPTLDLNLNVGSTVHSLTLPASAGMVTAGGSSDLWGYGSWTSTTLSSLVASFNASASTTSTINLNSISVTVYYTSSTLESDYLDAKDFAFAVPATQSITGVEVTIKGYSSATQTATVQLLIGGALAGVAKSYTLAASDTSQVLGGSNDAWSSALTAVEANATSFGVRIYTSGTGTSFLNYCTVKLYLTASNPNFNFIDTFTTAAGAIYNLALDANGNWWLEDATNAPGMLAELLTGTTPLTWGTGENVFGRAYISNVNLLSSLVQGADIPRQYNFVHGWWDRVTQSGPAAPPEVSASEQASNAATITSLQIASNVVTVTAANSYVAGEVGTFSGCTVDFSFLNGTTLTVLSTGLSGTQFQVAYNNGGVAVGPTAQSGALFTPQYVYPVATITQPAQMSDPNDTGHFQSLLWSAGPGSTSNGNVITVYYSDSFRNSTPDQTLVNAFNSGNPVYVYITDAPFGNGIWQITSIGNAIPPHGSYYRWYFTYQVPTSNYQFYGGPDSATGYYQITQATVTTSTPVPNLSGGAQVLVAGAGVAAWDGLFTVVDTVDSGALNITSTSLSGSTATYSWTLVSGSAPAAGQLVTVTNTNNANGILNVVDALIDTASGVNSGTFTVTGFASSLDYASAAEEGQATTAGTEFIIDPGAANVGSTSVNPIYGNSTGGTVSIVGAAAGSTFPIGAGTRQLVCMFRLRTGLLTQPSPPVTFTVATGSNYVSVNKVPIGPPGTVARQFAITQAGALGIAGGNFYTYAVPDTFTVNGISYTSTPLVVNDNTTTSAKFTFSDQVLLSSEAIDVPGNNLFNQIEIGNPGWIRQFLDRTFYGACQNKVQRFNNLSFDGGYLAPVGAAPALPLGWYIDPAYSFPFGTAFTVTAFAIASDVVTFTAANTLAVGQVFVVTGLSTGTYLNGIQLTVLSASSSQVTASFTHADVGTTADSGTLKTICNTIALRPSPNTGNSLYVQNQTASTQSTIGMVTQTAYQDAYNVPILNPNGVPVAYSVRIKCRTPSSTASGSIVVDLVNSSQSVYGSSYGSFTLNLSSITNQMAIYEGMLTAAEGIATIPSGLLLRIYGTNIPSLGDFEIDWLQIYPTNEPVLTNTVYVSYPGRPDAVDGVDGKITLNSQTSDPAMGMQVIHNTIFFPKANSIIECEISSNLQPSQWMTREVSRRVGAVGPNAMAQGNDWSLMLHKTGLYFFNGGVPYPISRELQAQEPGASLWDQINWEAAKTFWMVTDLNQLRIYIGVAMNTPNFWLPNEPTNTNPTQPNVILMCNYDGVPAPGEIQNGAPVHVTMFGDLKALDMRRKWSIWTGATSYGALVFDGSYGFDRIMLCNGIGSGKIYRLISSATQDTDDGTPIRVNYTTSGIPSMLTGQQQGVGAAQKQANRFTANIDGSGSLGIKWYPNTLEATYPVTCPLPVQMDNPSQENIERRMGVRFQRLFTEFTMDGTAPGFCEVGEVLIEATIHPWGSYRK